ncbi:MAG TPA: phosphate ABC transporter permease PstA [Moraxellaceae bacterium]|nr:phosphate ABC transporter permease PstA [Moraxellaceae bacterium]
MTPRQSNAFVVRRKLKNRLAIIVAWIIAAIGVLLPFWILFTVVSRGFAYFTPDLFHLMTPPPDTAGGLWNAIVGSLLMVGAATVVAAPVGILAGIYLAEYGRNGRVANLIRFVNDILLSAPSIVIGLFIYTLLVVPLHHFSGYAGVAALAVIAVPIIVRTTENMLQLVPDILREGAFALGSSRRQAILRVCLPAARNGIITGVLLAVARISGETAPLLFTALNNQFFSTQLNQPMANLPVVIFQFAMSPYDNWQGLAWAGAALITVFVLAVNFLARFVFARKAA